MRKLNLIIVSTLCALLFTFHSFAQPCLPEGIVFETQEQIDNFQTNYPNCTVIEGNVAICGNDITNLTGLNVLTAIDSNLLIGFDADTLVNPNLGSLTGLESMTYVGGDMILSGNINFARLL